MGNVPKLYAITVSKNYQKVLSQILTKNSKFFTKWFIVSQEDDEKTADLIKNSKLNNIELVFYPIQPDKQKKEHTKSMLTRREKKISVPSYLKNKNKISWQADEYKKLTQKVSFDKGGALRQVQKYYLPRENITSDDLVLILDSDIVLPDDFLDIISSTDITSNCIYASNRHDFVLYDDCISNKCGFKYDTKLGAGYFHLYKYNAKKLCKRTYDCGWVDMEFKAQFEKTVLLDNLWVKHLGIPDINWKGSAMDSFVLPTEVDELIKKYVPTHEISKSPSACVRNFFKKVHASGTHRRHGLPNIFLTGLPHSGVSEIKRFFENHENISFPKTIDGGKLNYFNCYDKIPIQKNSDNIWYMSHFPRLLDNVWIDYSESLFYNTDSIKKMSSVLRINKWDSSVLTKILFVVKNPIKRLIDEIFHFKKNYTNAVNWPGCPSELHGDINDIIRHELASVNSESENDGKLNLLYKGCYIDHIEILVSKLNLSIDDFLVIEDTSVKSESGVRKIYDFIGVGSTSINFTDSTDINQKYEIDIDVLKILIDYYKPHNDKLFDFLGYNLEAWT
jgi:hypothetical protein